MSRKKKQAYITLMVIGALAMTLDRFVFTGAIMAPDVAVGSDNPAAADATGTYALGGAFATSIPELPFPHNVVSFGEYALVRDLFAPPGLDDLEGSQTDNTGRNDGRDGGVLISSSDVFMARHSLNGIIIHQRLKIAIVEGAWVRIGQSVDGCTLSSVSGNEARFECFDGEAVLKVLRSDAPSWDSSGS